MTRERIEAMPADDWRRKSPYFNEPMLSKNLELAEKLKVIGNKHGYSAGEVAIAWTLQNPAVTAAIVGGRSAKQVDGICRAEELNIAKEEIAILQ
jgi:aryl-alcohol dehydrogenase-like predicted oxidoreductase